MTYNYNRLKGLIKEKCGTQQKFANELGISATTLNQRLNNITCFTQKEIDITKSLFDLTSKEIDDIFFTHK